LLNTKAIESGQRAASEILTGYNEEKDQFISDPIPKGFSVTFLSFIVLLIAFIVKLYL
jgi:hypothetical protein